MPGKEPRWTTGALWTGRGCHAWEPATDVYQTADGWVVKFDLAGVDPDDLTVRIENRTLYVSGTRRDRTLREGVWHYQMEITYSRFERAIQLPSDVANARVETEYRNGLLTLTFSTKAVGEPGSSKVQTNE